MSHPLPTRLKHAWAVLSSRIVLPAQTEGLEFMTALSNSLAVVALAAAAGDRLIAANAANVTALAQAQTDLANADATLAAALQPLADKLTAAAPAPVADATDDTVANVDSAVAGDAAGSGDTGATADPVPAA
jgi:hypothetical protein